MSPAQSGRKRRRGRSSNRGKEPRIEQDDPTPELSSGEAFMPQVHQMGDAARNVQKKSSLYAEIGNIIDGLRSKLQKERECFGKTLLESAKECEGTLQIEAAYYKESLEKFNKERDLHLKAFQDFISKFQQETKSLFNLYEQQREKELDMISEHWTACRDILFRLENSNEKIYSLAAQLMKALEVVGNSPSLENDLDPPQD